MVADMKNSAANRTNAASSCAGLFMLAHLDFDWEGTWIHVDMAAPAVGNAMFLLLFIKAKLAMFGHSKRLFIT